MADSSRAYWIPGVVSQHTLPTTVKSCRERNETIGGKCYPRDLPRVERMKVNRADGQRGHSSGGTRRGESKWDLRQRSSSREPSLLLF
ncbi:hypothetical protein Y1Q_0023479 [Alligator mississippiensis]|uniref:Uncharacterized protein n=1 Tax=Alligator mississippiensis TaxID=8496 RepID=A0A151NPP3_ALLMI|nr:hypothetical protein Y1Q_0023479 [Alligator mississippiensis]